MRTRAQRGLRRIRNVADEYPRRFWVLVGASFIDTVGRTLIFPFFALYVTQRFNVGMTEAGVLLAIFSVTGFVGNMLGGGLTDRFGRRSIIISGLVFSSISALAMGLVDQISVFYGLAAFAGLLSDIAGPAHGAMVADLLREEKRADGFGILRVGGNLAWIIGPTIGGFLASRSYLSLFVLDAIASLLTAAIVFRLIPETRPQAAEVARSESMAATYRGYFRVLADRPYAAFLAIALIMNLVYLQLYSTLSVYLRDVHHIPTQGYGFLMSANALLVVLTQFYVTRRTSAHPPLLMMALGSAFYLVGFTLYGVVSTYFFFLVAMLIVTTGEMIVIPVSQALVTRFAPEEMRGRYMAAFSLSWGIPSAVGPWAAGLIMDNLSPNLVWYLSGVLAAVAVLGFLSLHARTRGRLGVPGAEPQPAPA
jgi:MFS family permease